VAMRLRAPSLDMGRKSLLALLIDKRDPRSRVDRCTSGSCRVDGSFFPASSSAPLNPTTRTKAGPCRIPFLLRLGRFGSRDLQHVQSLSLGRIGFVRPADNGHGAVVSTVCRNDGKLFHWPASHSGLGWLFGALRMAATSVCRCIQTKPRPSRTSSPQIPPSPWSAPMFLGGRGVRAPR